MMIMMILILVILIILICSISVCISARLSIRSISRFSRYTCLSMKISNDKIDVDSYRKKSSKTSSISVINKANNKKSKADTYIFNTTTANTTINTDSLTQYIGQLVLTAKGLTVATTNNSFIATSNESINTTNTYSLSIKNTKSTSIAIPTTTISTNANTAMTLLYDSPLVFEKFSLNDAGPDVLVEGLWALGALSKKYLTSSISSNLIENSKELQSLGLRILSHVSETSALSSFQVSMAIISITRIVLATETNSNINSININNRYSSSLRISNTNTNSIINKLLTESVISSSSSQSISNILWSLGTISCPIPGKTLDLIYDRFALVYKDMNDQAISNILIGLLKAGITWESIPVMVQSILCSAICRECLRMSPQAVCNILYSLGGLGATSNVLTERVILAVELALRKVCIQMKGRDASQALVGLATMNIQWSMLSNDTKDRLSMSILKRANEWTSVTRSAENRVSTEIATIVSQIVRMKASWIDLTPPLKAAILLGLQSFHNNLDLDDNNSNENDDEYIKIIYSFSLLGLPLKSLPSTVMDSITSMIEQLSSKPLSGMSFVLLVKALNLLQVKWHTDIIDKTRLNILGNLNDIIVDSTIDVFRLLPELASTGVTWSDLPTTVKKSIISSVDKYLDDNSSFPKTHDILTSLVSLSAKWSDFPKTITTKMTALINANSITNKNAARIIRSLGNLNANISDIVTRNTNTVGSLDKFVGDMDANDIIILLKGLTKSGLKYQNTGYLSDFSWTNIINTLLPKDSTNMSSKDVSSVVLLFGRLGVTDTEDRLLSLVSSYVDSMTIKELIDTLMGFSLLNLNWQRLPTTLAGQMMKRLYHFINNSIGTDTNTDYIGVENTIKVLRCLASLSINIDTAVSDNTKENTNNIMISISNYLNHHNGTITATQAESILRSMHQLNLNAGTDMDTKRLVNIMLEKVCDFAENSKTNDGNYITNIGRSNDKKSKQPIKMKPPATLKLFADIGLTLPSLPPILKSALLLALIDSLISAPPRSSREMLVFLRRLVLIKVSASLLPPTAKSVIFVTTVRTFMAESSSSDSNSRIGFELLSALSSLGFVWLDLYTISPTLATIIVQSSAAVMSTSTNSNIALPRNAIIDMFKHRSKDSVLVNNNVQRLFSLWRGLGIRYTDLDNESSGIIIRISTLAVISSPHDTLFVLQTLASLLVTWADIPNRQRNSLSIAIGLAVTTINDQRVTQDVIKALIDLKGKWPQFSKELRDSLQQQSSDNDNALHLLHQH